MGEVSILSHVTEQFNESFLVQSANLISLVLGYERQGHFLKRKTSGDNLGWHLELGERYVRSARDKPGMGYASSVVTPGSKEAMVTAEHAEKKFLDTSNHRDCRSLLGLCQKMKEMRYDTMFEKKK